MNKATALIGILLMPVVVSAQGTGTLQSFIGVMGNIFGMLASIAAMSAIVAFFWGIALYVLNVSDEDKKEEGKSWMLWSVIALFVLITIWGIIGILQKTVGNTQGPGKVDIIVPTL